jgi:hypothetical protein
VKASFVDSASHTQTSNAATVEWTGTGAGLTLSPKSATNPVGTNHTVTAHVSQNGNPVSGVSVHFSVTSGPNSGKAHDATTGPKGNAKFTYTGTGGAGKDTIQASASVRGAPVSGTATKTWTKSGPAPPQKGESANATATGNVTVKCPGNAKQKLGSSEKQFPLGCTIDASHGTVNLKWNSGCRGIASGKFGGVAFVVNQVKDSHPECPGGLLLDLKSLAPAPKGCDDRDRRNRVSSAAVTGHLHAQTKRRRVRSRHRHSSGTVRGTEWDVVERCDGTLTRVIAGVVAVRDFRLHKTILVHAGHSYLARVPGGGPDDGDGRRGGPAGPSWAPSSGR